MNSQRHLFSIPDDVIYLNCAYMSPILKSSEEKGIEGLRRKGNPATLFAKDFFEHGEQVKKLCSQLIHTTQDRIAIFPSASYGLMNAIANVPPSLGDHCILTTNEFPSGRYSAQRWCDDHNRTLKTIGPQNSS